MDYKVVISAQAKRDLRAIVDFWADENPIAAEALGAALADRAASLDSFPYRGVCISKRSEVRKVTHTPYHTIYYRIDEQSRKVKIMRFWDGRRDPATLKLPD